MSWSYALDSVMVVHMMSPRFMRDDLFENVRRSLPASCAGVLMPVDFRETYGQSSSALFSSGDRRVVLGAVTLELGRRRKTTVRMLMEQFYIGRTVDDVLTALTQGVDPTTPGTTS